ncbi:hypothetical protein ABK040_010270 [Willaertia magna]
MQKLNFIKNFRPFSFHQRRAFSSSLFYKVNNKGGLITTPIYYVNGQPHIGHLYTTILTDAMFLYHRDLKKQSDILFSTGNDEHGIKVQRTALKTINSEQETDPLIIKQACEQFCDKIAQTFQQMMKDFNIQYTHYIRTSKTKEHLELVQKIWNKLLEQGDIYLGEYKGWYCTTDEAFTNDIEQKTIINPETGKEEIITINKSSGNRCEYVIEQNYKFKLSKYLNQIIEWLEQNPDLIKPKERYNELIEIIKKEQERNEDLSVSRTRDRVQWGIPVPNDNNHTIYVWLDALFNYYTVGTVMKPNNNNLLNNNLLNNNYHWPPTLHVIGKDILKFHGIYWPAFLLALGEELPKKILVHSYWLVNDIKMSKSIGNVISPNDLLINYGVEQELLRYYLLSEGSIVNDSSFSTDRFPVKINELADVFGNLINRMFNNKFHKEEKEIIFRNLSFEKNNELIDPNRTKDELIELINGLNEKVISSYEDKCEIRFANIYVIKTLSKCNQLFDEVKPWVLVKEEKNQQILEDFQFIVAETLRSCAISLYPVLPEKMKCVLNFLNQPEIPSLDEVGFLKKGKVLKVKTNPTILFKKILEDKPKVVNPNDKRRKNKQ